MKTIHKILALLTMLLLLIVVKSNAQIGKTEEKKVIDSIVKRNVYYIKWKNDGWGVGLGTGILAAGYFLELKADKATPNSITELDKASVRAFDRGAIGNYSASAGKISDVMLFTCVALPLTAFITQKGKIETRTIPVMVYEAYAINGGVTSTMKALFKRYRPFTYNSTLTVQQRVTGSARESFPSGHVSNTAVASFITAKILSDLYPDSKLKPLMWTTAATIPAVTGYLRYKAGKHFPTDIIAGYAIGATIGYIIPVLHKAKAVSLIISSVGAPGVVVGF